MSSLTRVSLTRGEWVVVSGEMVSGTRYRLIPTGTRWFRFAESASAPTETTSYAVVNPDDHIDYLYEGTPIHAYAVDEAGVAHVLTLAG